MNRFAILTLGVLLGAPAFGPPAAGHEVKERVAPDRMEQEQGARARYTPTVKLVEDSLPAVASIQTFQESGTPGVLNVGVGSASVIHGAGYLLTNDHVVSHAAQGQVLLPGKPPLPFRNIAGMSSEDLAVIKVEAGEALQSLPLGRSDDLMLGEPVLTIGNPGGLVHSVSTGIVSGLNRSTAIAGAFLPWMIQTSAAVSGGNSGGPLINALGQQIGVVTSKKMDGENINFAIAVDRVREVFPRMLAAELRYGFRLGVEVDMYSLRAGVTAVTDESPGDKAGMVKGDVIVGIDGAPVRNGFDFHLALVERKVGDELKIEIERGEERSSVTVRLAELALAEPVEEEGLVPGLQYEAYAGKWEKLPDFDALSAVEIGQAGIPTEEAYKTEDGENYGLRFTGFIKIPREGLYTLYTSSDDGSRLRVGGEVIVDNDGLHAVWRTGGLIRLRAGMYPVEVTFFEAGGEEELEVSWEGPGLKREVIPEEAWFRRENPEKAEDSPAE